MRTLSAGLLALVALGTAGCAPGTAVDLRLRSAPPPPAFEYHGDPRFTLLADLGVSVNTDDDVGVDVFGCNGAYYLYSGGTWYRGREPRGPWTAIEARRVPRRVFDVDDRRYRWRSHPEGWRGDRDDQRRDDRRGDRGDHGDH